MPVQTLSTDEGFAYDLNKNGRLDPYEDPRLPIEERSENPLFPFGYGLHYEG